MSSHSHAAVQGSPKKTAGITFAIAGAGGRGLMFATWLKDNLGAGSVVAVAEPRRAARAEVAQMHGIAEDSQFETWQQMLSGPRRADVLINATMDREHADSACRAMELGYHMLLEKPSATTLEDVMRIDRVRQETGRIVSVCHSLRYHVVYDRVAQMLREGRIGDVVSIDQLEAVEHIHQSHSFVRGNWGNESRSTFMLMSKSCHDIDIIASLVPQACRRVSSFGSLKFFRSENAPAGSPTYCVEGCPAERECPYHAMKIYGPESYWKRHAGLAGLDPNETKARLFESPYGVCVFKTDNDVVDHQVVSMEFEGGVTATFTMTAFTPWGGRYLRVHGTRGYLEARVDQRTIDLWEFWEGNLHSHIEFPAEDGGHGGGDDRLLQGFLEAVRAGDPDAVRTGTAESMRTHAIVFAAEESRRTGRVVELNA